MFKNRLKNVINKLENMLFVNFSCMNCEREIFENYDFCLCEKCFKKLDIIVNPHCKVCGESLGQNLFCEACYHQKFQFDQNLSYCYYTDVATNIIRHFKYSGKKFYAEYIAKLMFQNLIIPKDIDYITFVPASKLGKLERGYNQSEEIAKYISEYSKIPLIELLGKNEGFKNQASLNQKERMNNLKNAFFILENNKNMIKGKNILIIDDVFTTGTTLSRCAETLKKYKSNKIVTMTFAKTKFIINY